MVYAATVPDFRFSTLYGSWWSEAPDVGDRRY